MRPLFLVVDDDETLRMLIGQMLIDSTGGEVRYASGHAEALAAIAGELPDLITSDIQHVGETGDVLFQQIRGNAKTRHIPFVVISGRLDSALENYLFRLGVDAVFKKPFSLKDVERLVRWVLRS